jgi:hypothetical protein
MTAETVSASAKRAVLCVALLLGTAQWSASKAALSAGPEAHIQKLYSTLLITMKAGAALGKPGRYAQLAPIVQELFAATRIGVASIVHTNCATATVANQRVAVGAEQRAVQRASADDSVMLRDTQPAPVVTHTGTDQAATGRLGLLPNCSLHLPRPGSTTRWTAVG